MFHVVNVSRNANNGTNAGTFIVDADSVSSNRNRNIGTHLAVCRSASKTPARKGKYVNPIQFGRATEKLGKHQQ